MDNMNQELISKLAKDEACKPSLLAMRNMSIDEMLQLYIDKIDFSICSDLLNADFFLENSGKAQRHGKGIFVNDKFEQLNPNLSVLIGNCEAKIKCIDLSVSQLFMRDNSECIFIIQNYAFAIIDCFGDSKLTVHQSGQSTVQVNLYGNAKCEYTGNVKVNYKLKDKY